MGALRQFLCNYRSDRKGAAGVEFALVAIPFLVFIFGVMEAGRIVWSINTIQYAVEETSRYAALNPEMGTAAFQTYAEDEMSSMYVSPESFTLSSSSFTSSGVNFIEIEAQYVVSTLVGNILPGNFGNFTFDASARMPIIE